MALNPTLRFMVAVAAAKYPKPEEPAGLLDWITPLGKPLRECTGYECALIGNLLTTQAEAKLRAETAERQRSIEEANRELAALEAEIAGEARTKPRIRARAATQHTA